MKKFKLISLISLSILTILFICLKLLHPVSSYSTEKGSQIVLLPEVSPFLAINIFIKDFKAREPKKGLANLALQMLKSGTTDKNKLTIANILENLGGEINCTVYNDYALISGFVLKENAEEFLALLEELITASNYPQKEFERLKAEIIVQLKQQKEDPLQYAMIRNKKYNFPDHYYGYPAAGELTEVSAISYSDVASFNIREVYASDIILVVNGSFKKYKIKPLLKDLLSTFQRKTSPWETKKPAPLPKDTKIENQNYGITNIIYNLHFPAKDTGIRKKTLHNLVDSYLGDGLTSALFEAFREKQGISYALGSYFDFNREAEALSIYLQTGEKKFQPLIDTIDQILRFEKLPAPEVFHKIRNYHLTNYYQSQQSLLQRGRSFGYKLMFDLGPKYDYAKEVNKLQYSDFIKALRSLTKTNIFILQ